MGLGRWGLTDRVWWCAAGKHLLPLLALGPGHSLEQRFPPTGGQGTEGSPVWKHLMFDEGLVNQVQD